MGSTAWSDDHYSSRASMRASSGTPTFAYTAAVDSGKVAAKTHEKLDPKNPEDGLGVTRESRDSSEHPNSRAVVVLFDVTGSMDKVPRIMQEKLPQLMGLLLRKSYLEDPHILIGAIGDATCDRAPLQVGQFEAGIEIENDLTNIYIEQGGGGSNHESYELAMYWVARHTKIDCFEKRGERGFCFIIGDEKPYGEVKKSEVERIIGDKIQADIPTERILAELEERYETYYILPNTTRNFEDPVISKRWAELLSQRMLKLDDPAGIAELIASTIGMSEGKVEHADLEDDLKDAGTPKALVGSVSRALATVGSGKKLSKKAKGADLAVAGSGAASGVVTL